MISQEALAKENCKKTTDMNTSVGDLWVLRLREVWAKKQKMKIRFANQNTWNARLKGIMLCMQPLPARPCT